MNLALVLLIAYSTLLVAVGLWIGRRVRGSGDFFVAGRRLSAPLLLSTVLASNIGAGSTVGAAGLAYRDGLSAWWWNGSAAIASLALAFWIGPRIWTIAARHNLYTAGDYLELRYGASVRGIIAVLIWSGTLAILAAQLIAGAAVLNVVAGLPRWGGTLVGAAVMTVYFVAGGLLSSAWVNLVQLVVLVGGFSLAVPLILSSIGGVEAISGPAVPPTFWDFSFSAGPGSGWTMLFLLGANFVISPGLLQKVYGASSPRAIRLGIGLQAIALAMFAFAPVLMGMAARVAHPGIDGRDLVLPTILHEHLPPLLGALALAAIFSAEVSTCDAILFMLSTSLSQDLYKRFVNPAATDRQVLNVARGAAVAGALLGVVLAITLSSVVMALTIFYSLLAASLFVPIVGGLYTRRAGAPEALASIAAGVSTLVVVRFALAARFPWIDPTLTGIVAAVVAYAGVMLLRLNRTIERPESTS
ncbi:MAG: sodium:solute symporter family protein [Vicinamibacterales bacterium]